MRLDQHVQKYFKSPPKSPEQLLHRRQGSGKVNRPVQQFASTYLASANPNLSKRRDKVCLFCTWSYNITIYILYSLLNIFIRIIGHRGTTVEITLTLQQIVLNRVAMCPKVDLYQIIKILFQIQSSECRVCIH